MPMWLAATSMLSAPRAGLLHAALPRDDAVGAAEDGRGRHRRRRAHVLELGVVGHRVAARQLIDAPRVVGLRVPGEGRAHGDHATHVLGCELGELARIHAAQAPAHQAHLAAACCGASACTQLEAASSTPRRGPKLNRRSQPWVSIAALARETRAAGGCSCPRPRARETPRRHGRRPRRLGAAAGRWRGWRRTPRARGPRARGGRRRGPCSCATILVLLLPGDLQNSRCASCRCLREARSSGKRILAPRRAR